MTNFPTSSATTLIDTPLVGLEDIQRAAFYVMFESLNNALTEIEAYWTPRDAEYKERTGLNLAAVTLEPVENQNFYEGHIPSLIRGTPDDYPNCAVMATRAAPSSESSRFDQMNSWNDSVLIEIMVKAEHETWVNRRCHRTAEAVVLSITRNENLGGAVNGIMAPPSIDIGDVFAVRSPGSGGAYKGQDGDGARYVWQGASIKFQIQKDSAQPSSGSGTFSSASQIDYSQFIDQG
jgi:hypothetical protein